MKMQRTSALIAIAGLALGAVLCPSLAETNAQPKGPPKTMGDEGVLPSTSTVGSHVPTMSTDAPTPAEEGTGPVTPKGPPKRMGDEGKLPATGTMGNQVPPMQNDSR
jgi:hypothetical protein